MAKALDEITSTLEGREASQRGGYVKDAHGNNVLRDFKLRPNRKGQSTAEDARELDETDAERARRRRECHGPFKKDCAECREFELARALRVVRPQE